MNKLSNKTVTRFAPSPTGFLHIGGARTALFNWLYAKRHSGIFLLRIEDTDKARLKDNAIKSIVDSLSWLGIYWNGEIVFQSQRQPRHKEVAEQLLDLGKAYRCYLTKDDILALRVTDPHAKIHSPWRNATKPAPLGQEYSIRLKIETNNSMATKVTINDVIQGIVTVDHTQLDDMIILRSDGSPTYMMAAVVDDYDMGVTHIIRGDDHLTNAFRQLQIYQALNWHEPTYAHIPLIHSTDGHKLSKRHNAVDIMAYRDMGYLPEALCNYLLRLGWGHEDTEIITMDNAVKIFALSDISKSPARFDIKKLNFLNAHYITLCDQQRLMQYVNAHLELSNNSKKQHIIIDNMHELIPRSKTLVELVELASLYLAKKHPIDAKSQSVMTSVIAENSLPKLIAILNTLNPWTLDVLKAACNAFCKEQNLSIEQLMQLLRASVIGSFSSPPIYEMMIAIGQKECLERMTS